MKSRVFVVGVGMTRFLNPQAHSFDYVALAKQAVYRAIRDVNIDYDHLNEAAVGYVYGESCSGQRSLYEIGQSGIPIYNVNDRECSGGAAMQICYQSIKSGFSEYCLALGFDKNPEKKEVFADRTNPLELWKKNPLNLDGVYAGAASEYMKKYGENTVSLAKIAEKNYKNGFKNPYSSLKKTYNLKEIINSNQISGSLTKLHFSRFSDAAAAVLLCSEKFMIKNKLQDQAIEIIGFASFTNSEIDLNSGSFIYLSGFDLTKKTGQDLFSQAKMTSNQFDICEIQDTCSISELTAYEALGFCPEGQSNAFIEKNLNSHINVSGGTLGKGNCMGANSISQCVELCWQMRGMAGNRQRKDIRTALQHSLSLGGSCRMIAYRKANAEKGWSRKKQTSDPENLEKIEEKEEAHFKRNNERETCPQKY